MSDRVCSILVVAFFAMATYTSSSPLKADEPGSAETITLWNGSLLGKGGRNHDRKIEERGTPELADRWLTEVHNPTLTVFLPPVEHRTGTGILICPGGGYGGLALDKEGMEIARWFVKLGVAAFVLEYRCGGGEHQHPVPWQDASRAIRIIRSRAAEWQLRPEQIGAMGFSAGGHLASTLGTRFDAGDATSRDSIEQESSRPDFLVLIYPVISMDIDITHAGSRSHLLGVSPSESLVDELSNEKQVTAHVPPTFLVHATDDQAVPVANSLRFYETLVANDVPAELHVFETGGHGFGMRLEDAPAAQWPHLLTNWLRGRELIE